VHTVAILRRIVRWPAAKFAADAIVVACLTLIGASASIAQDRLPAPALRSDAPTEAPGDSSRLRLSVLYEQVARQNPRVDAALALAHAAEARVPGTTRLPDPQLQLGLMNRSLPSLAPMDPLGMTQVQVMQMVPIAGKLALAGNVASARADAARERVDDVRWDVRSRVAMAFYELYRTDRSLAVAIETRRLLEDVAKTAQSMYAVGDGRQADVLKARVEIAKMTEDIVRMRAMRVAGTATLAGLLDGAPDSTLASPELPAFPSDLPSLDSLLALADESRPMVRAGRSELRAADATARLATREIWPDLQVGIAYGQRAGAMGTERMGSFMVGATLPVFASSRQQQMREEAEAMRAMTRADLAAMRADTRARVAEAYANLVRARNVAVLYRNTILPQARAAVTSSLAAYRVGDVNLMTLLDNQMTVNRYSQELFALDAEQGTTFAELEMLTGRELFDVNAAATVVAGRVP
jgi:outer membrane protein, heavy metal efflux system